MPEVATISVLHPEQMAIKKPWERQEGETAKWHMRFKNFLVLGPKRTINAVFEAETKKKQEKSRRNAGPEWYNSAKKYQWKERAEAWDAEQDEQKANLLRQIAMTSPFISKPFRLIQLNSMADALARCLEQGHDAATYITLTKQLQCLMHDIRAELEEWNIHPDSSCDAAALDAWKQRGKRLQAFEQERQDAKDEETDRILAQIVLRHPELLPGYNVDEIADQLEAISQTKIADLIKTRLGLK